MSVFSVILVVGRFNSYHCQVLGKFFCFLCFIKGKNPVTKNSTYSTSTTGEHLKEQHPKELETFLQQLEAKKVLPTPRATKRPLQTQTQLLRTPVKYNTAQLHRAFTGWLVTSCRPANIARDPGLCKLLTMISGEKYRPPDRKTIEKIEIDFERKCRSNIQEILVREGIINSSGTGRIEGGLPFASLSIDKSTTKLMNLISKRLHASMQPIIRKI